MKKIWISIKQSRGIPIFVLTIDLVNKIITKPEKSVHFSYPILLLATCIHVFIVKAIIMNFLEDWDVGILYLSTKFEVDRSTKNISAPNLSLIGPLKRRSIIGQESPDKQTDRQSDRQTHRLIMILSTYRIKW